MNSTLQLYAVLLLLPDLRTDPAFWIRKVAI